jgi:hypothetical protein
MFNTPILFLIFNRPEVTFAVFEQIQKIQPKYLFIAADGPRNYKENELCKATRDVVQKIDWDCELKTLFRNENLGCAKNVSSAIKWFFDHVEKGIILEDDCYPDLSFFSFCEELLNYYDNNDRIMAISGFNAQLGIKRTKHSYFFAEIPLVWGWATWRKAWQHFQYNVPDIDNEVFSNLAKKPWQKVILDTFENKIDSWAYRWIYSFFKNKYICVYPTVSLVRNIGINYNATHTTGQRWWYKFIKYGQIIKMSHPNKIKINYKADMLTTNVHMNLHLSFEDKMKRWFYANFS